MVEDYEAQKAFAASALLGGRRWPCGSIHMPAAQQRGLFSSREFGHLVHWVEVFDSTLLFNNFATWKKKYKRRDFTLHFQLQCWNKCISFTRITSGHVHGCAQCVLSEPGVLLGEHRKGCIRQRPFLPVPCRNPVPSYAEKMKEEKWAQRGMAATGILL